MRCPRSLLPLRLRAVIKHIIGSLWSLDLYFLRPSEQSPQEIAASEGFSVVLPIHDAPDVAARCIESLEKYAARAQVILVDDGSRLPETAALIDAAVSRNGWQLVRHQTAQRHSRACEAGARLATRPYLGLLNSDCVITRSLWEPIQHAFETDAQIAVVGPALSMSRDNQQASRRARFCTRLWSNRDIYAFAERYHRHQNGNGNGMADVRHVDGSAFFVRRCVWQKFGGFHPQLPDYGNETEFCTRALHENLRLVVTKQAYVHHIGHCSMNRVMSDAQIAERRRRAQALIDSLYGKASQGKNASKPHSDVL